MRNMTAHGSLHLARKAEQVPQRLRDLEGSRRTRPLFYYSYTTSYETGGIYRVSESRYEPELC